MKDRIRMPVSRRAFIRAAGFVGVGVVATASFAALKWHDYFSWENLRARLEGYRHIFSGLDGAIRRHYSYLNIDPEGLRQFVTAYEAAYGTKTWKQSTRDAFERFLLSSDFFQNGADESRPVRFVLLYDPRRNPCYNPLARMWPDQAGQGQSEGGLRPGALVMRSPGSSPAYVDSGQVSRTRPPARWARPSA